MPLFQHLYHGFRDLKYGVGFAACELRRRLSSMCVLTICVSLCSTFAILLAERHHPDSDIHTLWDAFFFTTSQMTTLSNSMANPVTTTGQLIVLLIDVFSVTIVSTLAGLMGAFFYHRSDERRRAQEQAIHRERAK